MSDNDLSDDTVRYRTYLEPGVWIKIRPEQVKIRSRRVVAWDAPDVRAEAVMEPVGETINVDGTLVIGMTLDGEQYQVMRDHGFLGPVATLPPALQAADLRARIDEHRPGNCDRPGIGPLHIGSHTHIVGNKH